MAPSAASSGPTSPPSSGSPAPPPPPPPPPPAASQPPPPKPRRFRRYLITLILLTGIGFGGGVYLSLTNDTYHDLFTEYIPFGEEAVLFFQERDFRRRFPKAADRALGPPRDTGKKVTIPSKSGVSWNVAGAESVSKAEKEQKGTGKSAPAVDVKKEKRTADPEQAKQSPSDSNSTPKDRVKAVEDSKKTASTAPADRSKASTKPKEELPKDTKPKEVKAEPSKAEGPKQPAARSPLLVRIDPLKIDNAEEPIVQDLVKVINNIITVVNADNSSGKFTSAITAAKSELEAVGGRIISMKKAAQKAADDKIQASHDDFDQAAKELIKRLEHELHDQESRWKDEFESEREKIAKSYQDRLKTELDRSKEISNQVLHNELLEQAINFKRKFSSDIKEKVEEERNGRLAKLSQLSTSVTELEKLTSNWNDVVDANLKTQHLHVAVEAVRSSLESPDNPKPFVRELAALKEIAADDAVVNAAIASINPTAYQRGIPTSAQLIDRFRRVAAEVRKASLMSDDSGIASVATSYVLSKLMFRKSGFAEGDDIESILTRTEILIEEGDLDAAAREMNGLTGWAKSLSKDWIGEVRKVLEVQQALDVSWSSTFICFD